MLISGFTFCRNLVKLDYPFEESIKSLLPIVDEFVIAVGDSEDNTLEKIEKIGDKKIRIIKTIWDKKLAQNGLIYAQQTNIALQNCNPIADWAFYLQGDEVLHEKDYNSILESLEKYKNNKNILALMMKYKHFKGDYNSIDLYQYRRAVRIVRPGGVVKSVGDAYGFARSVDSLFIDEKNPELWRYAKGHIYHYGWVKTLESKLEKCRTGINWYREGIPNEFDVDILKSKELIPSNYHIMKEFKGDHPLVMKSRVESFPRLTERRSRWLNPSFYWHVLKHGFKG